MPGVGIVITVFDLVVVGELRVQNTVEELRLHDRYLGGLLVVVRAENSKTRPEFHGELPVRWLLQHLWMTSSRLGDAKSRDEQKFEVRSDRIVKLLYPR